MREGLLTKALEQSLAQVGDSTQVAMVTVHRTDDGLQLTLRARDYEILATTSVDG